MHFQLHWFPEPYRSDAGKKKIPFKIEFLRSFVWDLMRSRMLAMAYVNANFCGIPIKTIGKYLKIKSVLANLESSCV